MSTTEIILLACLEIGFLKHRGTQIKRLFQTLGEVLVMPNTQFNTHS